MARCDVSDLVEAGKCFSCLGEREQQVVLLTLLCKILQQANPMAECEVTSLLADGRCFLPLSEKHMLAVQTQLLCEILHSGGTGVTCLLCGNGAPTEDAPCDCSIYYSTPPNAGVWVWDSVTSAWECVINPGT